MSNRDKIIVAIETYSGKPIHDVEVYVHPDDDGVWGIKCELGQFQLHWLPIATLELSDSYLNEHLEEVEFKTWPPTAGGKSAVRVD